MSVGRPNAGKAIPRRLGGSTWDERRNTSRVFPVPPDAVPNALRALKTLDLALRAWIEEGHPSLTDDEHRARFGGPYRRSASRRA